MSAFLRKYATGAGADIHIPIIKRAVVDFAVGADWTPAAGDVKISIDGGAAANIATLPTALAMGNTALWKFVFSNAEITGKTMSITVSDSATKVVEDQCFIIETFGHASAMYVPDYSAALATPTNITAGTITNVTNLTNAPTAGDLTAAMKASVNAEADAALVDAKAAYVAAIEAAARDAILNRVLSGNHDTAGSTGKLLQDATASAATAASQATTAATQSTAANVAAAAVKVVTDKLDTAMEVDGGPYRFTVNALEQAPGGGGGALSGDQDAALTRIDRTVKGIAAKRE